MFVESVKDVLCLHLKLKEIQSLLTTLHTSVCLCLEMALDFRQKRQEEKKNKNENKNKNKQKGKFENN